MSKHNGILLLFLLVFYQYGYTQVEKTSALYQTILSNDSLLFNVGFNTCNIQQFENLLSKRLKFYHDKNGVSDQVKFLSDLKNGLCKNPGIRQVKRILVPESTEIFPLYKNGILYGAIQNGEHLFYEDQKSQPGSASFSNVWEIEDGNWKLVTSLSFNHQAYSIEKPGSTFFDKNDAIEKWLKANQIKTLGLGIIEDGKIKQVKVFGEIKDGVPAPYNTIFNVASLAKPVTAMIALKLVSMGKWSLDEPVYKYWTDPDIANDPRNKKITTRFILSHQTGLPNWRRDSENKKLSFQFEPGTKYQYSGEGFEYLRRALENKFQKSLQQLADELIFRPLKMYDTRYVWDEDIDTTRLAIGYDKAGNPYELEKNEIPNAADDLLTTIEDYGRLLVSIMNSEGLTKEVFNEMSSKQVASTKGKHFSLGFERYDFPDGAYALSHGGSDYGVKTIVFIFPGTKNGLLIFTNSDTGENAYESLVKHYLEDYGQKIFDMETK